MSDSDEYGGAIAQPEDLLKLEEGDEFDVYGGEYKVIEEATCGACPIVRVQKKSVGGWMDRTYRLEQANPTEDDDDTLVIRTKFKSHWNEYSVFPPEKIELRAESIETGTSSEPVVMKYVEV